jgi:hypothetical protein
MAKFKQFARIGVNNLSTGITFSATLLTINVHGVALICPDNRKELIWIHTCDGTNIVWEVQ